MYQILGAHRFCLWSDIRANIRNPLTFSSWGFVKFKTVGTFYFENIKKKIHRAVLPAVLHPIAEIEEHGSNSPEFLGPKKHRFLG